MVENVTQIKSGITSLKIHKEHNWCEKHYIWNPAACTCENGKYVGSIACTYVGSITIQWLCLMKL